MTEPSSSPQRHATRAPIDRPARLQFDDALDVVEARCRNISIGGMFVITRVSRAPGALVRFELDVDEGAAIRGLAEVVWMRTRDGGPGREAGMGVKFRFLEQRDRQQIFKLVSQHIKDRLANRQPFADPDASGVSMARRTKAPSPIAGAQAAGGAVAVPGFGPPPVVAEGMTAQASKTNIPRPSLEELEAVTVRPPEDGSAGPPEVASESRLAEASGTNVPRPTPEMPRATPDPPASALSAPPVPEPAVPEPAAPEPATPEPSQTPADAPAAASDSEEVVRSSLFEPGGGLGGKAEAGQQAFDFDASGSETEAADPSEPGSEASEAAGPEEVSPEASAAMLSDGADFGPSGHEPAEPLRGPTGWDGDAPDLPLANAGGVDDLPMDSSGGPATLDSVGVPAWLDEPVSPEGASPRAASPEGDSDGEDPYFQHLGADHFDHRPAPRKEFPVLIVAALGIVLIAALAYLFGDRIFDWNSGTVDDSAVEGQAESSPGEESADTLGSGSGTQPPAGPTSTPPAGSVGGSGEGSAGGPTASAAAPPATRPTRQPTTQGADRPSRPSPSPPPPAAASQGSSSSNEMFRALSDIAWKATGGGVEITLTADGLVPRHRLKQFRLENPPREAIRLLGVPKKFDRPSVEVGRGGVQQIRTGWHRRSGGPELHVVLDMTTPAAKIERVRVDGRRVIITVAER